MEDCFGSASFTEQILGRGDAQITLHQESDRDQQIAQGDVAVVRLDNTYKAVNE